jgi:hypothetical protein
LWQKCLDGERVASCEKDSWGDYSTAGKKRPRSNSALAVTLMKNQHFASYL